MEALKNLIKALLDLDPIEVEVHLKNGEKISYSNDDSENSLKKWLKKFDLDQIVKIEFKYEDGTKISIELPCGEDAEEEDGEDEDEDEDED
ncbi:hypothetical protein GC093_11845 [Paenibacillus sp. LMG 31456]|uniref:Uncharacterized protein n=1 Tax=Paenibacillus foliorum TaxID=2654974 RepID=A0A972GTI0_9BACL|nr:hypothetical protein [Paenibacillus foliorum]NOU93903.1 hypothetical protein [Paenibacillus foliorum]